jgi:tripartite ATP-independent transporter DctP family solute receptor
MKRLSGVVVFILVLSIILAGCGTSSQTDTQAGSEGGGKVEEVAIKLSWTTADAPQDPYAITAHKFKELLEDAAENVTVELYPNNMLGGERDVIEGMSLGTVDMGVITNAPISGFVPQFQALDLPFIFSSTEQAHAVLDGPIGQELLELLAGVNIKGFCFSEGGFRQMINNVRPVFEPSDVEGVKYRVMENPIYMGMFRALGSNATPMAWGEVFTAVQQGTIDGLEIPIPVIHQNKYAEVTKYLSLTNHTYSPLIVMMSANKWQSLDADLQAKVVAAAEGAIKHTRAENAKNTAALLEDLANQGMEVNEINDPAAFREKVLPLYDEFSGDIGADLLAKLLEATSG